MPKEGKVYLVGAGPGNPGLVSIRARDLIEKADVVVYDYLVHDEIFSWCSRSCEKICVGKRSGFHSIEQAEIEKILVAKAGEGKQVVRLKGGDPFLFGRGGEEALRLARNGVPFEVVPGITAAVAASAYAGIPLTQRNTSSSLLIITGHEDPEKGISTVDWRAVAAFNTTLCIYMGMGRLEQIVSELIEGGCDSGTPAAVIQWASLSIQRSCRAPLAELPEKVKEVGLGAPAIIIIGEVAGIGDEIAWFENRPLFGRRVVVTRSQGQASELRHRLEERGAEVVELPLVRISPDVDKQRWADVCAEFGSYDWIVFASPNGVRNFFTLFFETFPDVRSLGGVRFAAVGKATARVIEAHRLLVDLIPETATAEGLATALIEQQGIENTKILSVSGNIGGDLLVTKLEQEGGAIVDRLPVYKTERTNLKKDRVAEAFRERGADFILFTSSSAVDSFAAQAADLRIGKEGKTPVACSIGPSTSAKLASLGITVGAEAKEHNLDGLVEAVIRLSHNAQA